jgi:hypothetical protein
MDIIPAVAGNKTNVINAEFVKLTIYNNLTPILATAIVVGQQYEIVTDGTTNWTSAGAPNNLVGTTFTATAVPTGTGTAYQVNIYTFSSSYNYETINNQVYSPLGGLLAVGVQNRNIKATSADTSVSLSGIDGNNIAIVLTQKIKGSKIEIIRGFYNASMQLTSTAHRFTGIITSFNIAEDRHDLVDTFTVTLSASSFQQVLKNRVAGRKTNPQSWNVWFPNDTSMNQVYSIAGAYFDFGAPVTNNTTNPSGAALTTQQAVQSTPSQQS